MEEVHGSPALAEIVRHLPGEGPLAVLDLGPAAGASVDFFSCYRCRLQIVDLLGTPASKPGTAGQSAADHERTLAALLPAGSGLFDLVLVWDTFDFLSRDLAASLVQHLARLSRPGAWLLALGSSSQEQPRPPTIFAILDRQTLRYRVRPAAPVRRPVFSPAEFESLLRGFRIEHSFILRHHVHEWVAVREQTEERCG